MAATTLPNTLAEFKKAIEEALRDQFPDFGETPGPVMIGVLYFSTVWSLFEFRATNTNANQDSIVAFARKCAPSHDQIREFQPAFDYFRARYIEGHRTNHKFASLVSGNSQLAKPIEDALLERESSGTAKLTGLLLIAYCLRNNLFHGTKWAWGLGDQYENLAYATLVLTETLSAFAVELG
ncbi:hypothetical protein [Leisingera daeponensis]|uniref:hypothetical protein n=1 Tax=Leisingera daeponensis TaxID=405746 RepID=UPI001C9895FF|nr:hypothetical protein [Leisingera daeponensis]MBY6059763.1 hypothetical protein [Leisingera daeponensis]